jgi:hypothetical protein
VDAFQTGCTCQQPTAVIRISEPTATKEFAEPVPDDVPITFDELRDALRRVLGVDVPVMPPNGSGPHALRRVAEQNTRLVKQYRRGNVLLVGDSAGLICTSGPTFGLYGVRRTSCLARRSETCGPSLFVGMRTLR